MAYTYLLSYDNKSKKANCISVTKMAFDLQNMLFEYKSGFSITKIQLSITKMASQFTKWPLGLQVTRNSFGLRLILHIINYIVLNVKYILHFVYYIFLFSAGSQQETCMGADGILGISLYFLGGTPSTFLNAREK